MKEEHIVKFIAIALSVFVIITFTAVVINLWTNNVPETLFKIGLTGLVASVICLISTEVITNLKN